MSRQLLPCDVTAEDRARGCVWASRFMDNATEREKYGAPVGNPIINKGLTLNGTTQYVTYSLWGQMDSMTSFSCCAEFWPTFTAGDGADHQVFDIDSGTGTKRELLWKEASGVFSIYCGNTTNIINIPAVDVAALLIVGGRNVITFAASSGNSWARFNGSASYTSATAFTAQTGITRITAGARYDGNRRFAGTITDLRFYRTLLTANDHLALWRGGGGA